MQLIAVLTYADKVDMGIILGKYLGQLDDVVVKILRRSTFLS